MTSSPRPLRVFVHLANGYDATRWEQRWLKGEIPGFNERSPYGYHHAREQGCIVNFSTDYPEGRLARLVRWGFRFILGFDIVHAVRNRHGVLQSDVVWTHTESQHLSIALLLRLWPGRRKPKLVAQSVWLIDRWPSLMGWQRALYRWLMRRADVLTFLSPLNRDRAKELVPGQRCEFIPFGICADVTLPVVQKAIPSPLRILALGNDRHRDWPTLFQAFGNRTDCTVRVATQALRPDAVRNLANVELLSPRTTQALTDLYLWADVVVIPLKPNLHASGISVLEEAALTGRPAVSTDVGGLKAYFSDDAVTYVAPGDAAALREATFALMSNAAEAALRAARAQERMTSGALGARRFVACHVQLSHQLMAHHAAEALESPRAEPDPLAAPISYSNPLKG